MNSQNDGPWIVMKFGGTSVGTAQCWSTICEQARVNLAGGKKVMIVVSALPGTTNLLTRLTEGPAREESDGIVSELREKHQQLYGALGLTPSTACEQHWNDLRDSLPDPGTTPSRQRRAPLNQPDNHTQGCFAGRPYSFLAVSLLFRRMNFPLECTAQQVWSP